MANKGKVLALRQRETIDVEAANWLARLDRGGLENAERLALRRWLSEDPRHAAALRSSVAIWEDFDSLARDLGIERTLGMRRERRRSLFATSVVVASAVGIVALLAFLVATRPGDDGVPANYELVVETGLGEHRTLSLPDESEASLNSDTRLDVTYTPAMRHVRLQKGEARFQVTHDAKRPFAVFANGRIIEAVGTAFVVKIDDDKTLVSVSEGRVLVAAALDDTQSIGEPIESTEIDSAKRRLLLSGEELEFAEEQTEVRKYDPDAFQRRLAWTEGRMIFDDEPLPDVIEEFARHSEIVIELSEPSLAEAKVTGNFVLGDVDAFLEAIEIAFGIRADRLADDHVRLAAATE